MSSTVAPEMFPPFTTCGPIMKTMPSTLWAITPFPPPMKPWSEQTITSVFFPDSLRKSPIMRSVKT